MDLRKAFEYLRSNATGQPQGAWFNRKQGQEAIYAEPKNEMLLGQVSGYWRKPLARFLEVVKKNSELPLKEIAKKAKLDRYEVETLSELFKKNMGYK